MRWSTVVCLLGAVVTVSGHGRVTQPPSRASAWRFGFPTRPDYDDDGVNCGGLWHQWGVNRGRCGICGDRYDARPPRPHELGGLYGEGVIVARYLPGSIFTTTVHLTTSHLGYWEFKLCPNPEHDEQECFDRYPLEMEEGGTRYYPKRGSVKYNVNYRLPVGVVCDHCVLQWKYTAGNNWGVCSNGTQGLGCGNQEQFGACSDISIGVSKFSIVKANGYGDTPLVYHLNRGHHDIGKVTGYAKGYNESDKHDSRSSASRKKNKIKSKKQKRNKNKTKPYKGNKTPSWR